jgi:hypothetical protein
VRQGRLLIPVDNELLGDPAPGKKKYLSVEYSLNGVHDQAMSEEGTVLSIPAQGTMPTS